MSRVVVRAALVGDVGLYVSLWRELGLDEAPPNAEQAGGVVPRMLVAELDGRAVGVVVCDAEGSVGFVRQIMVQLDARRHGVATALLDAARQRVRDLGVAEVRLNVKRDNDAAIALYERWGMTVDHPAAALWAGDAVRLALPASSEPLVVFDPAPLEEALLEQQFSIPSGQLSWFRDRGDLIRGVREAGKAGAFVGVMRFSPGFPGAFPFRAATPPAARALLGEAASRRTNPTATIGLVVERDVALIDALISAGAVLRFWMVQMVASAQ